MEDRQTYIGGSDASAVLGMNRWTSPLMLWRSKTSDDVQETEKNIAMEVGIELEDLVAKMFSKRTDKKVVRKNATIRHSEYPFLAANIDRRIVGENALLECKTASPFKEKEWVGEEIPQEYIIQCLHYLHVTGYEKAYLAVLIGNHKFEMREILFSEHEDFIKSMVEKEIAFWENHVVPKVMPILFTALDGPPLFEMFPTMDPDTTVSLDPTLNERFDRLSALQLLGKTTKKEIEAIKNEIKAALGEAKTGVTDRWNATWILQARTSLDTRRLKTEMPEVYDQFKRTGESRVFRFKQIKEGKE